MANEAKITCSLTIKKGNISYQSQPSSFTATLVGSKGPSPGAITISTAGTVVSFSELTEPGLCRIQNLDSTNYVEFGIYEPGTSTFYPLGEILPGESFILRLSRNLLEEYVGTGTSGPTNNFYMKANSASCIVLVEAFER